MRERVLHIFSESESFPSRFYVFNLLKKHDNQTVDFIRNLFEKNVKKSKFEYTVLLHLPAFKISIRTGSLSAAAINCRGPVAEIHLCIPP